jgi:hypothetical protein
MTFLGAALAQQSQNLFAPTFPVVAYPLAVSFLGKKDGVNTS